MPTISTVALPKSTAGRRAKPLDEKFLDALVKAIDKAGAAVDPNGNRPFHVNGDTFDTKGKASADGRRYANAVAEKLSLPKVSVRVIGDAGKYQWGIYLPLPTDNDNGDSA